MDNLVTQCANDMWSSWNTSNTALQQRVTETTEAHNKLQSHLSKTMQEIYDQVCILCFCHMMYLEVRLGVGVVVHRDWESKYKGRAYLNVTDILLVLSSNANK